MNDPRNTDNAWIESIVNHYHDSTPHGLAFRWIEFSSTPQDLVEYEWVGVSEAIPLIAIHLEHLKKVRALELHPCLVVMFLFNLGHKITEC
jgi:hypothetical protein